MPRTNLSARNFPIISRDLQKRITKSTLLFIGCGLGSNIAILAARVGFKKFIVVDGDRVEGSNLNRQEFFLQDVGKNKAKVLKKKLKSIAPGVKVKVIEKFISKESIIEDLVAKSDFVINTADFDQGFFHVIKSGKKFSKWIICPFNVGFGSAIIVFNKYNADLVSSLGKTKKKDSEYFMELLSLTEKYQVPSYFLPVFKKMLSKNDFSYTPQIGPASFATASEVITLIMSIHKKSRVRMFPRVNSFDLVNV